MENKETKEKVVCYEKYKQGDVVMLKVDDDYFKDNVRNGEECTSS